MDNIVATILDILGKTKDGLAIRLDPKEGLWNELAPIETVKRILFYL